MENCLTIMLCIEICCVLVLGLGLLACKSHKALKLRKLGDTQSPSGTDAFSG